ncbi:malate dehydrogenase (quinone) [Modestobacter roseus]|uniref:Probable malate:quinone oxidoreductase n=1 Tax=Modestobacter roseus TaxID=1181884 RepID=A0A562IN97_9ACTN|nr:malate dehydrogenase (quinone) [Modestobacter roseus]MQA35580.1 malate dehydrogenase (quinone) [Modestobacter roseus]TWH72398.1 malate dehydrogenase (quinone) [Modestobacter roseus]
MSTDGSANPDVVLVGGGIMSATLAALLGIVAPDWTVEVFEAGSEVAGESSGPWNNAGTGHSALCELNYTPARPDGTVDPAKAVGINEQFQVSRQFWSHLVRAGLTDSPKTFITSVPHISFVTGDDGHRYMRNRYEALAPQPLFAGLEFSDDPAELDSWVPLMMQQRSPRETVAATRSLAGTDVNFGALTRLLTESAVDRGVQLHLQHRVQRVRRDSAGRWATTVKDLTTGRTRTVRSRFLFVGAGGGALPLLQSAGIPEIRGFGGFPVSGQFLRTRNPELVAQHQAKVYGQAKVGAPPMSVPHLDLRLIDGEQALLFGPYAGFSPKFLKAGSMWDLPRSVRAGNLGSMLGAGWANIPLTRYLIGQVLQSEKARFRALEEFVPTAESDDWELITAGQRVQVIKQDEAGRGVLQFGTELIVGGDGSIAGLLGASPGASTATSAMLTLLERCFPDRIDGWRPVLQEAIPSYGRKLSEEPELLAEVRADTTKTLELQG